MHSAYLLRRRGWLGGWLAVRHAPVDRRRVGTSRLDDKGQTTAKQLWTHQRPAGSTIDGLSSSKQVVVWPAALTTGVTDGQTGRRRWHQRTAPAGHRDWQQRRAARRDRALVLRRATTDRIWRQQIDQLARPRVVSAIQTNVQIADDVKWFDVCGDSVHDARKLSKERRRQWTGAVDDDNDTCWWLTDNVTRILCSAGNTTCFWKHGHFPTRQCIVHGTRLSYCVAVLRTSLLQTYDHLTHRTSTRLTMPWSIMQKRLYQIRVHDIDELRQRLITVWCRLEQRAVDEAIDQW